MGRIQPTYDGRPYRPAFEPLAGSDPVSGRLTRDHRGRMVPETEGTMWDFILWIIAVILVIWGIVSIFRSRLLMGIVLIVVGLLVGPGGVSLFS